MQKHQPWFRDRAYGTGWYPSSAEGWLVLIIWFLVVLGSTMVLLVAQLRADMFWRMVLLGLWFLVQAANTITLLFIAKTKGDKPHWLKRPRR